MSRDVWEWIIVGFVVAILIVGIVPLFVQGWDE